MRVLEWISLGVGMGTPEYAKAKSEAELRARQLRAKGENSRSGWRDDYNDTRASGKWVVVTEG